MPKKLKAKLVMVNLPSGNPAQTRDFYSQLLGIELIRTLEEGAESYHASISEDGIDLFAAARHHPSETPMPMFHVDDLDAALQQVTAMGGKVVWGPTPVAMSDQAFQAYQKVYKQVEHGGPPPTKEVSRAATVQEPGGTYLGLLQVAEHLQNHFQVGKHQKPITDMQLQHLTEGMQAAREIHGPGKGR